MDEKEISKEPKNNSKVNGKGVISSSLLDFLRIFDIDEDNYSHLVIYSDGSGAIKSAVDIDAEPYITFKIHEAEINKLIKQKI